MIRRAAQLPETFAPWIMHLPGPNGAPHRGAVTIFPHAGGSASGYKELAFACCTACDTFIVQYPRRADRLGHPAAQTVPELARGLFEAGPWRRVEPLRLFGHSMGALVAFEFARLAEEHGIAVHKLWVSAGPPPATIAASPDLPTGDEELRADLADLGGTDARLLADEEFAEMLTTAARADYEAVNRYECAPGARIRADVHAICGRDDRRIDASALRRWAEHTEGTFGLSFFDGGHFYVNQHIGTLAHRVVADV